MSKKWIALAFLTIFSSAGLFAQQEGNKEKIKALKIAFFTERIELSSEEAAVFWPLYNEYESKREALREQERQEVRDRIGATDNFDEQEAKTILSRYLELEEQQEELDKQFYRELAAKLSAAKVLRLFRAEHEFRRRLLREYRKRSGNRR